MLKPLSTYLCQITLLMMLVACGSSPGTPSPTNPTPDNPSPDTKDVSGIWSASVGNFEEERMYYQFSIKDSQGEIDAMMYSSSTVFGGEPGYFYRDVMKGTRSGDNITLTGAHKISVVAGTVVGDRMSVQWTDPVFNETINVTLEKEESFSAGINGVYEGGATGDEFIDFIDYTLTIKDTDNQVSGTLKIKDEEDVIELEFEGERIQDLIALTISFSSEPYIGRVSETGMFFYELDNSRYVSLEKR